MALPTTLQQTESNLIGYLTTGVTTTGTTLSVRFFDRVTGVARAPQATTRLFVVDKGSPAQPLENYEIVYAADAPSTTGDTTTLTGVVRGISFFGNSLTAGTGKTHSANAEIGTVDLHYFVNSIVTTLQGTGDQPRLKYYDTLATRDADVAAPLEGDYCYVTGVNRLYVFNGSLWTVPPIYVYADATARDAELTAPELGMLVYLVDTGIFYGYGSSGWSDFANGAVPNGSETVSGKFQAGTIANMVAHDEFGSTGAITVVQTKNTVTASAGDADEGKAVLLNSFGKIDYTLPTGYSTGGDGSDGDHTGALTIAGADNSIIVKNFINFTPGANTVTTSAQNSYIYIKVQGDADLTGSTLNFSGKGALGGVGGNGASTGSFTPAQPGVVGSPVRHMMNLGGGGTGGAIAKAIVNGQATSPTFQSTIEDFIKANRSLNVYTGAGGGGAAGGGADGGFGSSTGGGGGRGGAGGGCLILEVAGNIILNGTTINVSGAVGTIGANGSAVTWTTTGGGGGGGGAGGFGLIMYNGTLTDTSKTLTLTGGAGGIGGSAGGTGSGGGATGGGGGSGGSNPYATGTSSVLQAGVAKGDNGGTGASGNIIIVKNTFFS